jgi:cyanophycin synthetase
VLDGDQLCLREGSKSRPVMGVAEIPATLNGAARYNVANALAAAAMADLLGFGLEHIIQGLGSFENSVQENPGRLNRFQLGTAQAIVDFAHNPHGFVAIFQLMAALPVKRRLILLGQAGDRDEPSIREMARITWGNRPDMIVIKELTMHLRGREPGEIPAIIEDELQLAGTPPERFRHCGSELEAVRWALAWAQPGDLLMLLVHDERAKVLEWLEQLTEQGWSPGSTLPELS